MGIPKCGRYVTPPELVAQIRFVEWTAEGRLRHAAFLGLRSDKSAREVRREWPDYRADEPGGT